MTYLPITRREFLAQSAVAGLAAAGVAAEPKKALPRGKAQACIFIWLGGGAGHIDTFDPKRKGDGKKVAGSYYDAIPSAIQGVKVCAHLRRLAPIMDRCVPVRSLHHDVVDEHAAATNRLHTGRPTSGTIVYPSIGSVVARQLKPASDAVPAYIVMGYPNVTRGPGFLGAKHGYVYLTETDIGPNGLVRPPDVNADRQARREELLGRLRDDFLKKHPGDEAVHAYAATSVQGFKLAGPQFMQVFNLKNEPDKLRESYGGEFGQRCLLARRLVEAGTRFLEVSFNLNFVNGTGWDVHNEGIQKQHELIDGLDQGLATLIRDLEEKKLLDRTLVVVATEFGRPAEFDGGGGRGHYSKAFSGLLAGGGLRSGRAVGSTDELGKTIVDKPVSIPDFHATIYAALDIDPSKELYAGERPVPITDGGRPIAELF